MNHTPTPWKVDATFLCNIIDGKNNIIARCDNADAAAYIVHCVNMHEELIEAITLLLKEFESIVIASCGYFPDTPGAEKARAVLAKEKEE